MAALAAAAVFACDERVADDNAAAYARAEREQHEAVVLLSGPGPELAVGSRIGVVGKRDGKFDVMANAVADREIPPAWQVARPQDHTLCNIHWPRRRNTRAGNILGTQQSGHIATIGYELYCELLEQAVRRLKKMPPRETIDVRVDLPGEAFLPRTYVPDMRMKIDLYRRLTRVIDRSERKDIQAEMVDRFGPLPPPVQRLAAFAELRIAAARWSIESIVREEGFIAMPFADLAKSRRDAIGVLRERRSCG